MPRRYSFQALERRLYPQLPGLMARMANRRNRPRTPRPRKPPITPVLVAMQREQLPWNSSLSIATVKR